MMNGACLNVFAAGLSKRATWDYLQSPPPPAPPPPAKQETGTRLEPGEFCQCCEQW